MLDENELLQYFDKLNLPRPTHERIRCARAKPSQIVEGDRNNMLLRYPFKSKSYILELESPTVERAAVKGYDNKEGIVEWWE